MKIGYSQKEIMDKIKADFDACKEYYENEHQKMLDKEAPWKSRIDVCKECYRQFKTVRKYLPTSDYCFVMYSLPDDPDDKPVSIYGIDVVFINGMKEGDVYLLHKSDVPRFSDK